MNDHQCEGCGEIFVERQNPSKDAAWLGTWFDHPPVAKWSCTKTDDSVLVPSDALLEQERHLHDEHHRVSPDMVTAYCRRVECAAALREKAAA